MTKPVKRVDVSKLTPEQQAALGQFIRDCKAAQPHVQEMQDAAKALYVQWLRSPQWSSVEGPRDGEVKQSVWHVKPEINYVDHIEGVP
jgi:hypothetical protein